MRKIIAIILSLAIVATLSVTAFAASEPQMNNSQEMTVTAISYSTFVYTIPESLEVTSAKTSFTVGITDYDLADGYSIQFTTYQGNTDKLFTMTNTADNTKTANLQLFDDTSAFVDGDVLATFTKSDLASGTNTKTLYAGFAEGQTIPAGTYTGVVSFRVDLIEG